ncbi:MAG: hypothetical protein K8R53_07505, partial [Bacteroidales bacterium]|nr:hypothetical protein [Bacteroidales bacterium]
MKSKKLSLLRKKNLRILGIIITLFIFLFIIFLINAENIAKKEVSKQLNSSPDRLYDITYSDLKINLLTGSISVMDLQIKPTDTAIVQLNTGQIKTLTTSNIGNFTINGVNLIKYLRQKQFSINKVTAENINIDYLINSKAESKRNTLTLHQIFSENFKQASIDKINILNASLNFYNLTDKNKPFFELDSVKVIVKEFEINEKSLACPIPVFLSDIKISTGHFSVNSLEYYTISTSGIEFDVADT